jgi:hypothetical protein
LTHLKAEERDALQNIEIAFESVRALWSGVEFRKSAERWSALTQRDSGEARKIASWLSGPFDAVRANWTWKSVMMRHALRMAVVAGVDVVLIQVLHLPHGFWLAMTSIIVLQPYGSGTLRRGVQRVGVAGGALAALLAAALFLRRDYCSDYRDVGADTGDVCGGLWVVLLFSDADLCADEPAASPGLALCRRKDGDYGAGGDGRGGCHARVVAGA